MMKIGLITLHRIVNYGSVLQTYATQLVFNKLGHTVEIIDYYPKRMHLSGMLKRIKNKNEVLKNNVIIRNICKLILLPSYIKRFGVFKSFLRKYIKMTPVTYYSNEELIKNKPDADVYCTGSDQVWNSDWNERIEKPYFLDFIARDKKCFAYAASFGKKELYDWEKEETKKLLQKYNDISLRESSGVNILEDLGIKIGKHVLDPTLLLNKEEWQPLVSKKYANKKYILLYSINRHSNFERYAKNVAKKLGLPLYYVSYHYHDVFKNGKLITCPKVEEFLSLIYYAQYVLTDSFHCTAFSINFNKQFAVYYPKKFGGRLSSLIDLTKLTDRVISDDKDILFINNSIDFVNVNKIIEINRNTSIDFISKALSLEEVTDEK